MPRTMQRTNHAARPTLASLDPDALKSFVRDGLVSLTVTEREDFVQAWRWK